MSHSHPHPPATLCRDAKQGASPGEPPPLPVEQQAGQALPPRLLQLVERVCGVISGRAKAEDLVVLLQSCLPAFCTAVRHLERGDSTGIGCGSRKRGSWIQLSQLCPLPDQQSPGSLAHSTERQTAQEPGWMGRTQGSQEEHGASWQGHTWQRGHCWCRSLRMLHCSGWGSTRELFPSRRWAFSSAVSSARRQ